MNQNGVQMGATTGYSSGKYSSLVLGAAGTFTYLPEEEHSKSSQTFIVGCNSDWNRPGVSRGHFWRDLGKGGGFKVMQNANCSYELDPWNVVTHPEGLRGVETK